jgi:hypothetical protein
MSGNMRKTLLAVGFAVLVSMMLAPHGGKQGVYGWGPFFSAKGFHVTSSRIWYGDAGRVMIDMLALEIVFLAVLLAIMVNVHWRREGKKKRNPTSAANSFHAGAFSSAPMQLSKKDKTSRKRWIIGLSIVALLQAYVIADERIWYYKEYKRFNSADRLATGHVIDVDPGKAGSPAGSIDLYDRDEGDPGEPPSSHYWARSANGRSRVRGHAEYRERERSALPWGPVPLGATLSRRR